MQSSGISEATQNIAARVGALALSLEVAGSSDVTGSLRRLRLRSDVLRTMDFEPGQDLMFNVPAGGGVVRRRYTIRHLDRAAGAIDVDIVRHGDGPGARWARSTEVGERIEAVGPRGKVTLVAEAEWHLFVGDESFSPAALAMSEVVPGDQTSELILEVAGPDDHPPYLASNPAGRIVWVYPQPQARAGSLVDAVRTVALPVGRGHAYLGGEAGTVSALRAALIERGLPADAISAKAYWRSGSANAEYGEPAR